MIQSTGFKQGERWHWKVLEEGSGGFLGAHAADMSQTCNKRKMLVYNRVPKCGSSTITGMLRRLQILRGYRPEKDELKAFTPTYYAMGDAILLKFPAKGVGQRFELKTNLDLDILWRNDTGVASFSAIKNATNLSATCESQSEMLPQVYIRHQRFVDVSLLPTSALGEAKGQSSSCRPRYINVDRDPIDKCVSSYYFETSFRYKSQYEMKQKGTDKVANGTVDINECVAVHNGWQTPRPEVDPEAYEICLTICMPTARSSWMYYCGFHEDCEQVNASMFPNNQPGEEKAFSPKYPERAWARAKKNVEEHFAVVGITSRMNETLKLLEHRLPQFFGGATWLAHKLRKKRGTLHFMQSGRVASQASKGHDENYVPVTPEVRAWLESQIPEAMDFYRFLEERFTEQLKDVYDSDLEVSDTNLSAMLVAIDNKTVECP
jgi:hypothetical protein